MLRSLERHLYRHADAIVSLLPEAWRYIQETAGVGDAVTWISNGAVVPPTSAEPRAPAERSVLTVIYMGAHGVANVLDVLLSAVGVALAEELPLRFVLVGDGPERPRLMEEAERLGLSNVEFRAAVPKYDVQATLQEADVLVALLEDTALYQYGISLNKLFDYMAAGKPVVLSGRTAHDYVRLANCGVTVPPRDPDALAHALASLAGVQEEDRRQMGERGRQYLLANHSWDRLAGRYADLLGALAQDVGRSHKR
jgi:glycosyltransferase involved in cell wall biosynthesis